MINSFGGISEDKIVNATGSYNATATMTSGGWVMQVATFKAAPYNAKRKCRRHTGMRLVTK